MSGEADGVVFQRVTGCLRKPIVRFRLSSGREVELLGFHLEPGWALGDESPRSVAEEVVRRLYPNERAHFVDDPEKVSGTAWLCVAYFYSDRPARLQGNANYSLLLACGLVRDIDVGVRGMASNLLFKLDWEATATDDLMW